MPLAVAANNLKYTILTKKECMHISFTPCNSLLCLNTAFFVSFFTTSRLCITSFFSFMQIATLAVLSKYTLVFFPHSLAVTQIPSQIFFFLWFSLGNSRRMGTAHAPCGHGEHGNCQAPCFHSVVGLNAVHAHQLCMECLRFTVSIPKHWMHGTRAQDDTGEKQAHYGNSWLHASMTWVSQ